MGARPERGDRRPARVERDRARRAALDGLHWTGESERPVGATIDCLLERGVDPAKLVLVGFSLGGTGPCARPDGSRASPPAWPARLSPSRASCSAAPPYRQAAAERVDSVPELVARMDTWIADPADVRCPFLSIAGGAEPPLLMRQALDWHERLDVPREDLIVYDQASGADPHCQLNNPTRLTQDVSDWVAEVVA